MQIFHAIPRPLRNSIDILHSFFPLHTEGRWFFYFRMDGVGARENPSGGVVVV